MLDFQRWDRLWIALGTNGGDPVLFQQLHASYIEPWRAYHNAQHIEGCLAYFDAAQFLAQQPAEVEVAIWFHDAIYDSQRSDNEERSAEWAQQALVANGIALPCAQRVAALILATKHDQIPTVADAALLVDVDLAFLGVEPTVFAAYNQAIRQEYHWVPEALFRTRRIALLQRFLDRPRIYQTEHFYTRFERQARQNLAQAITLLERRP